MRAPTVIIVMSVVPIRRAAIVAALRRGLRATFAPAIRAGSPPSSAPRRAARAARGRVSVTSTSITPVKLSTPPTIAARVLRVSSPIPSVTAAAASRAGSGVPPVAGGQITCGATSAGSTATAV